MVIGAFPLYTKIQLQTPRKKKTCARVATSFTRTRLKSLSNCQITCYKTTTSSRIGPHIIRQCVTLTNLNLFSPFRMAKNQKLRKKNTRSFNNCKTQPRARSRKVKQPSGWCKNGTRTFKINRPAGTRYRKRFCRPTVSRVGPNGAELQPYNCARTAPKG